MSLLFWKKHEPPDTTIAHEPARGVDEQHALPVDIFWRESDEADATAVSPSKPLPVSTTTPVETRNGSLRLGPVEIQGIAAADALDANDAMGSKFILNVPDRGTIREVFFHDLDDEGINKELWCFSRDFTAAANDAAFSCTDADNLNVAAVFLFSTWRDADTSQVGMTANTPVDYYAPEGQLFCQVKTLGADNIAAGSMPRISMLIEPRV